MSGRTVVVAGGGMAGVCAATAAAEAGARVLLLEKGPQLGGTARLSGGLVWTDDTYEHLRARNPRGDAELARTFVDGYVDAVSWLEGNGAEFGPWMSGLFGTGIGRRLQPDMPTFFDDMAALLKQIKVEVRYGVQLCELLLADDGRIAGVKVRTAEGFERLEAGALVLATGGFAGNTEMLTRYVSRYADRMILRAHPLNTGDGLVAAMRAGAATSRAMHAFYGHLLPAPPARIDPAQLVALTQYYSIHSLLLNRHGERFIDETEGDELNAQALASEPGALGFLVVDERLTGAVSAPAVQGFPEVDRLDVVRRAGGVVLTAATLVELAEQITAAGGNGWRSVETLEAYNQLVVEHPERLPVPRARRRQPVDQPPFMAVPVIPGITMTQGGLRIDSSACVHDKRGEPIPGLFAAGSDGGGVYHENYAGGLSMSTVFGRVAGTSAATHVRAAGHAVSAAIPS